ncbi:MAG: DUF456 domain-containing protein [Bacteroidaceae bacterium]|nr:DUF456 domain-containing protein [Bacteroidaceae bacterium]
MEIFLLIISVVLVLIGLVGSIVPGLPGPPLSFAGLLCAAFSERIDFSTTTLIIMGVLMVLITVLDYVVPAAGAKMMGGTKQGVRGSNIGLVVGLILSFVFPPIGLPLLLIGPFIGAYIGEKSNGSEPAKALKAAFGTFLGFLAGTAVKVIYAIILMMMVIVELVKSFL